MIQHKPVLASFGTKGVAALNDLGAHCCSDLKPVQRLQQDKRSCSRIRDVEGHFKTEYYIKSRIMIFCWGSNCSTTAWGQNNCSTDIALEDNLTEIVTSTMKQFQAISKQLSISTQGNLFQAEAATEERMHQDKGAALIQQQTCCSWLDLHCVYDTHCILYTCTYCTDWLDQLQVLPCLACCMWAHIIQCCSMWAAHMTQSQML